MADLKISELPVATAPAGTELIEIVQGGVNKQTTTQDIADLAGGGGTWGSITGTLSDQTDLNTALNNRQLLVNSATALVDAASMDLTAIKHTLTTSSATRTFTISYTGDDISMRVVLNATSSVFTFPAGALCVNSDGSSSGDNTCSLAGTSGDVYVFAIKNWGSSVYTVVCKNTLQ